MAFQLVQSHQHSGSDNVDLTGVAAGNLIVVIWHQFVYPIESGQTCSDGVSSLTALSTGDGTYGLIKIFYLLSANAGNRTYTVSNYTGGTYYSVSVYEFSYSGSVELDDHDGSGGSDTTVESPNITTTGSGSELVMAASCDYGGGTYSSEQINGVAADNSYSCDPGSGYGKDWYRIVSSTFTGNATATLADSLDWAVKIVSFKEVGGVTPLYIKVKKWLVN